MNEIVRTDQQFPDALEDLSRFVLVNEEKVVALRAQIRAIKKVSLAKEVYEQKLAEAQEIGQITVEAAQKMGELLLTIQKQSGNQYTNASSNNLEKAKTKTEITSEMGMTKDQVSQYQQMALNPDAVQAAIQKAIEKGDVVSRSQVMKEIKAAKEEAESNRSRREKFAEQKAERLESENKSLKERVEELESKEPEIVEVMPDDYELAKVQARSAEESRLKTLEKLRKAEKRIKDLETRQGISEIQKKLEAEAGYFTVRTLDYIQKNGGFVWITERLDQLPKEQRKEFVNTVYAIDAFAKQMIENIGGYGIE